MIQSMFILAQTPQGQGRQGGDGGMTFLIGMMLFVGVFFFMTTRSQRRERKKKAAMIDALKKNDRVMTVGGVIGTVVSVKESEVVLKVDEATNTRMTFSRRSVQQVITSDEDLKVEA